MHRPNDFELLDFMLSASSTSLADFFLAKWNEDRALMEKLASLVNEIAARPSSSGFRPRRSADHMTRRSETLDLKPGVCRICGCTEQDACVLLDPEATAPLDEAVVTCWWLDAGKTLCSNPRCVGAVPLETLLELGVGREPTSPQESAIVEAHFTRTAGAR